MGVLGALAAIVRSPIRAVRRRVTYGTFERDPEESPETTRAPLPWYTVRVVAFVAAIVALQGYDIGVMAGARLAMQRDRNFETWQSEIVVGCLNFVSAFGALAGGMAYNKHGAVRSVGAALALFVLGTAVAASAYSFTQAACGRAVCGVGVGLAFATCPAYLAEISPPARRGAVVAAGFELAIVSGLLLGYVASLIAVTCEDDDATRWRVSVGAPVPVAILLLALVPWMPESPRWLMREPNPRAAEALEVLRKTFGVGSPGGVKSKSPGNGRRRRVGSASGGWRGVFSDDPACRRALVVGVGLMFFQQACGTEAAVYYVPTLLRDAGWSSETDQIKAACAVGATKTFFVLVSAFVIDGLGGRRRTLLTSVAFSFACSVALAASVASVASPAATLTVLCLYVAAFSAGVGPVTWVVNAELWPRAVRARGTALGVAVNRATSGAVAMSFLSLSDALGGAGGAFACFAGVCLCHFIFAYALVPELKGRSLEQIE
ncbi:major facilitator superfamily, partial [Micromonas pusilla CCMP1545]